MVVYYRGRCWSNYKMDCTLIKLVLMLALRCKHGWLVSFFLSILESLIGLNLQQGGAEITKHKDTNKIRVREKVFSCEPIEDRNILLLDQHPCCLTRTFNGTCPSLKGLGFTSSVFKVCSTKLQHESSFLVFIVFFSYFWLKSLNRTGWIGPDYPGHF